MSEIIPEGPPAPDQVQNAGPDRVQPDPVLWPECGECRTPYVLRRGISFSGGSSWAWFRPQPLPKECRHKGPAVMCWDPAAEAKRENVAAGDPT